MANLPCSTQPHTTQSGFRIDVANVKDAPVAAGDSFAVEQGLVLEIGAAGVLANDTDADDDTLSVIQNTSPTNGTVVVNNDGSFTYTPNTGFVGTDNFTYEGRDWTVRDSSALKMMYEAVDSQQLESLVNAILNFRVYSDYRLYLLRQQGSRNR